jgi:hypothetical protein
MDGRIQKDHFSSLWIWCSPTINFHFWLLMLSFACSPAQISKLRISSSMSWRIKTVALRFMEFLLSSSKIRNAAYGCRLSSVGFRLISERWTSLACGCGRSEITEAHCVCPSFSKLLKLYWTRAVVSSLRARILKNVSRRLHECVRTEVGQYKTSEPIQAILL